MSISGALPLANRTGVGRHKAGRAFHGHCEGRPRHPPKWEEGPSCTLENRNKPGIRDLLRGFRASRWTRSGELLA
jgi:hypothetical protein